MTLVNCPECKAQISDKAHSCPKCGYPIWPVAIRPWAAWGFEWKSKQQLMGWPLVHITIGFNRSTGRLLVSRGIIAIGQFGVGVITLAQFGIGMIVGFG